MDKLQARRVIKETFENPFDKVRFTGFIKNLLNEIEDAYLPYRGNYIWQEFQPYISSFERIGKYSDGDYKIEILIVQLKKETSLEKARTRQRNFIAKYLNGSRGGELKDAALVAFVSPTETDWRFSLVRMDYQFEETKTGKIKVKQELTPARRWSFLVGSNEASHTAQSRLVNILADDENNPTLKQLEDSFNIETVTKEFFLQYRNLFIRTKEALDKVVAKDDKVKTDFESKGVDTVNFAKKLLGQIVFLYFLQKKGWFGVERDSEWGSGSKHFLRELFKGKHGTFTNFFNDILEPLFYEALRIDRRHDDDYYSRFNCKIPFLNGGLFDPIGNYDWVHTDIIIPNELFSNKLKTKDGDTGNGILDIFDLYNFTVKEDEPLEKEVAIDPELLGKAYEKFNAIRPDNFEEYKSALKSGQKGVENKFNKKFGVYYTPREIVHYMCQQSLVNYLHTELNKSTTSYQRIGDEQTSALGNVAKKKQLEITAEIHSEEIIKKEAIENLVKFADQVTEHEQIALIKEQNIANGKQKSTDKKSLLDENIKKNAQRIDNALANITVCDPAVGSGAFPVGMMHEIVRVRNVLSAFISNPNRTIYRFKRNCIERSLYGVDIDPGAVEIAKLRLWLSLVVDEEDIRQIKPLPNLDYKIVCGNSLIGVKRDLLNDYLFKDLEKLKPLYFEETNPTKKQEYKKQIDELISQITDGHTEFDFEVYFSEVFKENSGFDLVLANPPYVGEKDNSKLFKEYKKYKKWENILTKRTNLYYAFLLESLNIIKNIGNICLIVPNEILTSDYAKHIREKIVNKAEINFMLDFNKNAVFKGIGTNAMIFCYGLNSKNEFIYRLYENILLPDANVLDIPYKEQNINQHYLKNNSYWRFTQIESFIKDVEMVQIDYYGLTTQQGIITGCNQANGKLFNKVIQHYAVYKKSKGLGIYVLKEGIDIKHNEGSMFINNSIDFENPKWVNLNQTEKSLIKPLYAGNQIKRYYLDKPESFVIWLNKGNYSNELIKKIPSIKMHLDNYKIFLINRNALEFIKVERFENTVNKGILYNGDGDTQATLGKGNYYLLQKYAYGLDFEDLKIMWQSRGETNFFLSEGIHYGLSSINYIYVKYLPKYLKGINERKMLLFILGILNSKLYQQYYKGNNNTGTKIKNLDIVRIGFQETEKKYFFIIISEKIDSILCLSKDKNYIKNPQKKAKVKALEREIDQLVYQLYGLTEEEIRIVEAKQND